MPKRSDLAGVQGGAIPPQPPLGVWGKINDMENSGECGQKDKNVYFLKVEEHSEGIC